jgi:hypothetical protein
MNNYTNSSNSDEKLFYKYQSLKLEKDGKDNDIIYAIENLANNQLYLKRPDKFNDPYDSRTYWCMRGIKERHINHLVSLYGFTREYADHYIEDSIDKGYMTRDGEVICYDPIVEKDLDLHGYSLKESLPRVCCFSGNDDSILMWSHYADSHTGICLRFRPIKDWYDLELGEYYLEFDSFDRSVPLQVAIKYPFRNMFNRKKFLNVTYKNKDEICPIVNYLDTDSNLKMTKCLLNKFIDWHYEEEYRILITRYDIDKGLLSEDEFEQGLVKYRKEDLEGIIFGMKITYENAKLVYDTVKKNYLDEGIAVNFYEAKEIPRKFVVGIGEPIKDVEKYIDSLL